MTPDGLCTPVLEQARAEGRAAFIGYLPVGYPNLPHSLEAMRALVYPRPGARTHPV